MQTRHVRTLIGVLVAGLFLPFQAQAETNAELLKRIVAGGSELGNHSYTHPNLAEVRPFGVELELNATQRLIEAYTGRSTRLFRAPYFGDAEPSTADELGPAQIAQARGYTIVGLHVDPGDWRTPGTQAIVDATVRQVESATPERSANVVLLHDGGGNRSQTVAALPAIIDRLRADGYHFVGVSQLAGLGRDAVMPPITGGDQAAVRADVGIFLALAAIGYAIRWLFFFAIALGIARAVLMTVLALINRRAYADLVQGQGTQIDIAISPAQTIIGELLAHVRRGDVAAVYSLRRGDAEALEAVARGDEKSSKVVGKRIDQLPLPPGAMIGAIVRDGPGADLKPAKEVIIAHHDTVIRSGDHVIVFLPRKRMVRQIEKLFQVGATFF